MLASTLHTFKSILADHFFNNFEDKSDRIKYGANESYWNKYGLKELKSPGVIFTISQMAFPKGMSLRAIEYSGNSNAGQTIKRVFNPIQTTIDLSMAFYAQDFDQHLSLIHKYVELAHNSSFTTYIEDTDGFQYEYPITISNFLELTIPPAGRQSSDYDSQGLIYLLEGGVTLDTVLLMDSEKKIVRSIRPDISYAVINDSNINEDEDVMEKIRRY